MAAEGRSTVNPDLQKERDGATFETLALASILEGNEYIFERRRECERLALEDEARKNWPEYHFLSKQERYGNAIRKSADYLKAMRKHELSDVGDTHYLARPYYPNEEWPMSLHRAMFIPTIESQATEEQQEKWLTLARNFQILGTYAQTEMGHGTFLRGLETTATYDPNSEEFIMHSPTLTSIKWWPGGLGKTCNHAVVMALLFTKGIGYGIHAFIVQLRSLETHEPMPGVEVGDIGPKMGFDSIDNGFLRLSHYRIPRQNMLMKNSQVLADGTYVKREGLGKLTYGTMVFVRAMLVYDVASRQLAEATTVAIRYSCVRRQSEIQLGAGEPQVLDYQTQQYKLLPQLATAYAFWISGLQLRTDYFSIHYEILQGKMELLAELHANSAGLKAFTTSGSMRGIEQCRLACGGHGFSQASGLPKIYAVSTAACTYEGENTVMFLQTARFLVKSFQQAEAGHELSGSVAYLSSKQYGRCTVTSDISLPTLIAAYQYRAYRLLRRASERMVRLQSQGRDQVAAWNESTVILVKAVEAHCHLYTVKTFQKFIEQQMEEELDAAVVAVLTQLCQLYATHGICNNAADYLQDGFMTKEQLGVIHERMLDLLRAIRPNAVALVDAFDFHDEVLCSALGAYDGNVYERLFKWAQKSPLNDSQVHKSFEKYLQPLMEERRQNSKL